jgi:hypothetical protein
MPEIKIQPSSQKHLDALSPVANELMEMVRKVTSRILNVSEGSIEVKVIQPPVRELNSCGITFELIQVNAQDGETLLHWSNTLSREWVNFYKAQANTLGGHIFETVGFNAIAVSASAWVETYET